MASKLQFVSELADQTAHAVTHDVGSWKEYLDTAARIYRYSFDDQLLIYAQRPDATACASMELWNGTMRRWVRPGSKGIALIHKNGAGRPHLEYVFDVTDTYPVKGARTPYLWKMREDHHAAVLRALDEKYGPATVGDIGDQLMELAARAVNEVYRDHLTDLAYDVGNSLLEELDDLNLEVRFRNVLTASVQYTLLTRCGLDPADYLEDEDLLGITEFSTPDVLHHLGSAASAVSMEMLNEIGKAVKSYDREAAKSNSKNMENSLAISRETGYTGDAREFIAVKRESKERSDERGTDLHESGRLPDPRSDDGRAGGRGGDAPGQVRAAEGALPARASQRDIHVDAADRASGAAPAGDRPAGAGAGGPDGERFETAERRGRSDEGPRSDGLGAGGEQLHSPGGGAGSDGDRLQVNQETEQTAGEQPAVSVAKEPPIAHFTLFPTVEEQVEAIAEAQAGERREGRQETISLESPVPDAVIGRALTSGGNGQHSIEHIVAFFQKNPTGSAAASFMEKEFGESGKGVTIGGQDYALWFSKEGFRIAPGWSAFGPGSTLVSWVNAAAMASSLLREGRFAAQEKIDGAQDNEYRELAEKLWYLRQDFSDSAKERNLLPTISQHFLGKGFPDDTKEIAELLKDPASRQQIAREMAEFTGAYDRDSDLLRSRHHPNPQTLLADVVNLFTPRQEFRAAEGFAPVRASFITEDEIDRLLMRGGNVSEGRLRIYSYFMRGHNAKECAEFLRNEYGVGGHSSIGFDKWHDSKGIRYTRQDEKSGFQGYATVHLNWNQVQKRIRALVDNGRYLSDQDREHLTGYEHSALARKIYWFYHDNPNRTSSPAHDLDEGVKKILAVLESGNPEKKSGLLHEMRGILAVVPPDSKEYQRMAPALRDMDAFTRNEYSLFTPLPEAVLEAERQERQAAKEAQKAEKAQRTPPPPKEPEGTLAAAARALGKKMQPQSVEDDDGQISFDLFSNPASDFPAAPTSTEPPAPTPDLKTADPAAQTQKLSQTKAVEPVAAPAVENGSSDNFTIYEHYAPMLSQPQQEQAAESQEALKKNAPVDSPDHFEVSPVTLYRDALAMVDREISRGGLGFDMREHTISFDAARSKVADELSSYLSFVASGYPDIMTAYQTLPKFREWLIEDILERNYRGAAVDAPDGPERHANDPDAPEWARGAPPVPKAEYVTWSAKGLLKRPAQNAPTVERSEPEQDGDSTLAPPVPEAVPDSTGAGAPEQPERTDSASAEPDLAPNVEEYLNLKAQHPDKLIGVQVGDYMMFYGKDAEEAAPALGTNLITREIPGLGGTAVTGSAEAWQATLKNLLEHGHSVVLSRPDTERGPDAPYEIIKERDAAEYIPIGMELTIDGRRMKIDSVDFQSGNVSLQDMDLQGWFPVFRLEPISFVREFVEELQNTEEYMTAEVAAMLRNEEAAEAPAAQETVELDGGQIVSPAPAPPSQERHNFHITDDNLGAGGEKTKYQYNVAAIRALKQIEAEGRLATPEEQETLSRYVGWGGIAKAFDPDDPKWAKEYAELKELLTPEEYNSARSTVLNAHYTSPTVIKAIYQAVEQMNFKPGTVLEPSMGVGNFFGLLPDSLGDTKLYGVELDSLTGRIAKQLYQNADITVDGFEKTGWRDFFDLAVGNVPFGQYQVNDPAYNRLGFNIHNYFFAKALDQVRPGGIVAFVTSRYTMDAKDPTVRKYLAERADLLGAIRLPNNAFKANAGTEVVSDIIFLQKRDRPAVGMPGWVQVGQNGDGFAVNSYFLHHPDMVLGTPTSDSTQYARQDYTVAPIEGADLSEQLAGAVQRLAPPDRELLDIAPEQEDGKELESIPADPNVRNFSYAIQREKLYFRENSRMTRVELGKVPTERVKGMIAVRDSARKLIDLQLNNASAQEIQAEQANLNRLYDQFTAKHGLLNSRGNKLAFEQDSSYPLLCSLEVVDDEGRLERKADMFTKRTIQNRQAVTSVDTAAEALAVSISEKACVDLGYMASLMGGSDKIPQIVEDLKGVIFKDPTTGPFDLETAGPNWARGWQTADEYLSGDVRRKLYWARIAAEDHPEFSINVEKLEQVQPKDLTASEISVRIGASWIDPEYYQQFMFELFHTPERLRDKMRLLYSNSSGEWRVLNKSADSMDNVRVHTTYGTKRINAYEIFEASLNQRDVRIFDKQWVDGKETRVLNEKQTMIAQQKQEAIGAMPLS